ncbi:hypothetical protein [Deinococcus soli (ex Cha et al. 2016)]|uniref:Uncharacterized protein n=2 Tax=Deinococcus soli (ex Cha et al. 2016) TaxID=1309411 RepID=A0ACC6KKV6_9DEIO|nr:hypothetical protein [Deinococcus soli (ex Cha et al. 2016)]MDR6218634.1 hypothetical protein [Deinococcus soli (ex Cha et al. 2016)]MDR6328431.1 hypothetical protein [Deinococcus soli (ex Cha et al. 2016)]MDR6753042.1 hypothetical protein [Deinococcus soli (ex Cha et al. 2016)]
MLTPDQQRRMDLSGLTSGEAAAAAGLLRAGVTFTLRARHELLARPDQQRLDMDSGHWSLSADDLQGASASHAALTPPAGPVRGVHVTRTPGGTQVRCGAQRVTLPHAAATPLAQYLLHMQPPQTAHAPARHLSVTGEGGQVTLTLNAAGQLTVHLTTSEGPGRPVNLGRAARSHLAGRLTHAAQLTPAVPADLDGMQARVLRALKRDRAARHAISALLRATHEGKIGADAITYWLLGYTSAAFTRKRPSSCAGGPDLMRALAEDLISGRQALPTFTARVSARPKPSTPRMIF